MCQQREKKKKKEKEKERKKKANKGNFFFFLKKKSLSHSLIRGRGEGIQSTLFLKTTSHGMKRTSLHTHSRKELKLSHMEKVYMSIIIFLSTIFFFLSLSSTCFSNIVSFFSIQTPTKKQTRTTNPIQGTHQLSLRIHNLNMTISHLRKKKAQNKIKTTAKSAYRSNKIENISSKTL